MDLPLTDVLAAFPANLKRHGNSRAVTIPPQYHHHEILIVIKEKTK